MSKDFWFGFVSGTLVLLGAEVLYGTVTYLYILHEVLK